MVGSPIFEMSDIINDLENDMIAMKKAIIIMFLYLFLYLCEFTYSDIRGI